jgi:hypothetical protein
VIEVFSRPKIKRIPESISKLSQPHARWKLFGFWRRETQTRKLLQNWESLLGPSRPHRAKIMLKLGLHSLTEIIHYAIRHKIVSAPGAPE